MEQAKKYFRIVRLKPWITFVSLFIFLNTLLFYGFVQWGTWLTIAILLIPLHRRIGYINFLVVTISLLLVTGGFVLVSKIPELKTKLYYRPHEMLATIDRDGLRNFKKNTTTEIMQPHGNLKVFMSNDTAVESQPRFTRFKVDSFGFRNDTDYAQQNYLLVGDSFVASYGASQDDTLSSQLKRLSADVYNVGFPGGVPDYTANIKKFIGKRFI